jgi:hypothetical protein
MLMAGSLSKKMGVGSGEGIFRSNITARAVQVAAVWNVTRGRGKRKDSLEVATMESRTAGRLRVRRPSER